MQIEIDWRPGERTVSWTGPDLDVIKEYDEPPQSVSYFQDPPSIVIVESISSSGPRNAVIYETDGTERTRLRPPELRGAIGFDQVFQSSYGIEAVFITTQGDFHGTPDLRSGEVRDVRDWR